MKKITAGLFALLMAIGFVFVLSSGNTATAESDCDYNPVAASKAIIWHASCDLGDNRDIPVRCMAGTPVSELQLEMYDSHMVGFSPYGEEGSAFMWHDGYAEYMNCDGWGDADGVAQVWVRDNTDLSCLSQDGTSWIRKWKGNQQWHNVVNNGFVYFCRVVADE